MAYPRTASFGKVVHEDPVMTIYKSTRSITSDRWPGRGFLALTTVLGLCLLLPGCGSSPPESPSEPAERSRQPAGADPAVIARQLVADFLSLPASEVTLVFVESKDFGDPSLGCPEPGMSYPQVITPGHRVVVEADGRRFDVRVSGASGKLCRKPGNKGLPNQSGEPPPEHTSPITSQVDRARADLAAQLDLVGADIEVVDVRPFAPNIAAPGCRPECDDVGGDCGYLIGLFYDGRRYEYHAHDGRATPCPPLLPI